MTEGEARDIIAQRLIQSAGFSAAIGNKDLWEDRMARARRIRNGDFPEPPQRIDLENVELLRCSITHNVKCDRTDPCSDCEARYR